jgi:hypothetical protein
VVEAPGGEAAGEVDAHQAVDDGVGQGAAGAVADGGEAEAAVPVLVALDAADGGEADLLGPGDRLGALGDAALLEDVLVEQQPEVGQAVGGVVAVGDGGAAGHRLGGFVEADGDAVVDLLLPVAVAGGAAGGAVVGGGGPVLPLQLAEGVAEGALVWRVGSAWAAAGREKQAEEGGDGREAEHENVPSGQ